MNKNHKKYKSAKDVLLLNKADLCESLEKDLFLKDLKNFIGFSKKIVDFSSKFGEHSIYFSYGTNNQVIHINNDNEKLKLLKNYCYNNQISNIEYKSARSIKDILESNSIDFIYCKNVLENSKNPSEQIKTIASWGKRNGFIVICVKHSFRIIFSNLKIMLLNIFIKKKKQLCNSFSIKKMSNLMDINNIDLLGTIPDSNFDGFYIGLDAMKVYKTTYCRRLFAQIRSLAFEEQNFYFFGKFK